jgi:hypothetical protein
MAPPRTGKQRQQLLHHIVAFVAVVDCWLFFVFGWVKEERRS